MKIIFQYMKIYENYCNRTYEYMKIIATEHCPYKLYFNI